jgi:hypothetical protein
VAAPMLLAMHLSLPGIVPVAKRHEPTLVEKTA